MKDQFAEFEAMYTKRKEKLRFYSKYNSIRELDRDVLDEQIYKELDAFRNQDDVKIIVIDTDEETHFFYVKSMTWESNYFNRNIYKLQYVLFCHDKHKILSKAIRLFISELYNLKCDYCYIDIPAEDNFLIQALGMSGFKLVESRITYALTKLQNYEWERFSARIATTEDLTNIKGVASKMRNNYDRTHSETFFTEEEADRYLATYAEAAVNGFTDYVLVPSEQGISPDAFLAANNNEEDWENYKLKASQVVLAAVDSDSCKGWYGKLISEMCYISKEAGIQYVIVNTQVTNRAAIHTFEKHGFRFGHTSHILSIYI